MVEEKIDQLNLIENKPDQAEKQFEIALETELLPEEIAMVEALIFSSKKKLTRSAILEISNFDEVKLEKIILYITAKYQQADSGIQLKEYNDSYLFQTKKSFAEQIEQLFDITKVSSLSSAALETLAIIAYRQPVTRAEIEEIRGVKVERTLNTLGKYELITELGRKETIGNPIIYGTTDQFLEYLDIEDLSQLPEIERVEKLFAAEIEAAAEQAVTAENQV
jgi:segregation and condensation protein B